MLRIGPMTCPFSARPPSVSVSVSKADRETDTESDTETDREPEQKMSQQAVAGRGVVYRSPSPRRRTVFGAASVIGGPSTSSGVFA